MDDAIEATAFLPAAAGSHLSEDFTAVSYGRNKGCGKGNDRFPCKIIIFLRNHEPARPPAATRWENGEKKFIFPPSMFSV